MKLKSKIALLSMYPIIVYLAILNAMNWEDYEWRWSEKNSVLALQYLMNGAWFISVMAALIICVLYVIIVLTEDFKK